MYQSLPWPTSTVQLCFPDVKPVAPSTHTRLVQRSGLSGRTCLLLYCTQVNSSENFRLDWAVFGSRTNGTEHVGGKSPDVNTQWWPLSRLAVRCTCPLTTFNTGNHLIPNAKLQRSEMLCRVEEDVSYALWLTNIALGPETWRQIVHVKHPLVTVFDDSGGARLTGSEALLHSRLALPLTWLWACLPFFCLLVFLEREIKGIGQRSTHTPWKCNQTFQISIVFAHF